MLTYTGKKRSHTTQTAYICFSVDAAHFYRSLLKPQTSTTAAPLRLLKQETRPGKHLLPKSGPARSCDAQAFLQTRASPVTTHGIICRAFENPDTWMSDVRTSDANVPQVKDLCFRYLESESNSSWSKLVPKGFFFFY